ncbi:hypothetical protein CS022_04160 [Veronia nyctiphanis]|uniref:Uncharacterized protein n=1 Tax=Veronia nyctiphanis TaxID=1278244 RepID=A0A4Q0YSP1_9GAMM|nr:hypothetical protein CS022_04160 [Veronia nyctiphanis]
MIKEGSDIIFFYLFSIEFKLNISSVKKLKTNHEINIDDGMRWIEHLIARYLDNRGFLQLMY